MSNYFMPERESSACTTCVYTNVYVYATVTGVGVEVSISDAQFVGFLSLAPLFARLDIVTHACLLQNIPFISS